MKQHNAYFYLIPKLGILTVLYLLEIYEADENFEECGRIMEGISAFNIRYKTDFPTRTCDDLEKEVRENYEQFGLNNENIDMNKYYAYAAAFYAKQQELRAASFSQ